MVTETAPAESADEIINDPIIRRACWHLLREAQFGFSNSEYAAFVLRNDEGKLFWLEWRDRDSFNAVRWVGAIPSRAVAILHTHPNWLPQPSRLDLNTAQRTHLPVYVVTRTRITVTDGTAKRMVIEADWKPAEASEQIVSERRDPAPR